MKIISKFNLLVSASVFAGSVMAADITGAGATFPYPVYSKWARAYNNKTGTRLNYQSIGSGGGIKQILAKTVDFGASDAPLKPEVLEKNGMIQFPTVMGGVVPVVNLEGIKPGEIKLDSAALVDIYLGKIKKWNDSRLAALNPGVKLRNQDITVVHRSDGSGTTFIFTNYLSKVSNEWKDKVGNSTAVQWPAPTSTGGKGNEGVASFVQRLKGSIGYVEYAYAKQNKMTYVMLKNRAGNFVGPTSVAFQAAAAGADWKNAKGFYEILTNEPGKDSWPITGATFILLHKIQSNPERTRTALRFFDWAYKEGDKMAEDLDYIPMPDSVVKLIHAEWASQLSDGSGKKIWK